MLIILTLLQYTASQPKIETFTNRWFGFGSQRSLNTPSMKIFAFKQGEGVRRGPLRIKWISISYIDVKIVWQSPVPWQVEAERLPTCLCLELARVSGSSTSSLVTIAIVVSHNTGRYTQYNVTIDTQLCFHVLICHDRIGINTGTMLSLCTLHYTALRAVHVPSPSHSYQPSIR